MKVKIEKLKFGKLQYAVYLESDTGKKIHTLDFCDTLVQALELQKAKQATYGSFWSKEIG